LGGVDLDGVHFSPVHVGRDAEVEVRLWAGDRRTKVAVCCTDLDDCGIVAVDLDDGDVSGVDDAAAPLAVGFARLDPLPAGDGFAKRSVRWGE
jgi:hypothetical protein